jgi:tetratricopeptide (TPR) repeat protein
MRTRLSAAAAALAEGCWLVALVVVPVFFNPHSTRMFEEDKIPLLRSIAIVTVVALVIRALEEGRAAWTTAGRPIWRRPLVLAAVGLTAAYVLATIGSIAPQISVWGSYERMQGLYTWLSYIAVFLAIVLLLRTPQQIERLVTVILLASVAPAVYAIVQHLGRDPIRWGLDVTVRAHGTAGNPIFLAAYLIMVVPLTLARTVARLQAGARRTRVAAFGYLFLLTLQLLALMYSGSRGPLIGLGVSIAVLFLVMALQQQRRRLTIGVIACIAAGGLFIGVLNVEGGPLTALRREPTIEPLSRLFTAGSGTGKVRVVIWEGAAQLLGANPRRDLLGYGPETLYLAYTPFYPPELARYESRRVAPDRAHNETFDALITTGGVGCLAELVLFVSLFVALLQALGLAITAAQRRTLVGLVSAGAVVGALAPYVVDGSFRFSGLCLPLGIVAGLVLYLLATALRRAERAAATPAANNLLLLALLGGLLGHFVEIQFGIAVSSTRLLFWVYAALVVVLRTTLRTASAEAEVASALPNASGFDTGLTVGLVLLLLTFSFYRPDLNLGRTASALLALLLGPWLFGGVIAAADTAGRPRVQLGRYGATSFCTWLLFAATYVLWLSWRPSLDPFQIEHVLPAGRHLANCLSLLYLFVFAIIALSAGAVAWRAHAFSLSSMYARGWHLAASLVLLIITVPAIIFTNLDGSRADVFLKQIDFYTREQHLDATLLVAEEARRLDPNVDRYATAVVRVLMELARTQPPQREAYLPQAQATLESARRRNPLNLDNTRNLARLQRLWAGLEADAAQQKRHFDAAQGYYAEATRLSPNNAALWNEWALLFVELHQPDAALPLLDHSLGIDDGYTTTWWLRANIALETGSAERAVADYDRALSLDPTLLAAWSGKAMALARLNRLADAIAANREALKLAPHDLVSHRNLALLYRQAGQPDLALKEATAALKIAKSPQDKSDLAEFILQLEPPPASR